MKRRLTIVLSLVIITVVVVAAFAAIETYKSYPTPATSNKPFYVGVTYSGNSTNEAERLIDRVKNCTNLFVLQSGQLMYNLNATEQICDYAVNSGLNIIVSYSTNSLGNILNSFLSIAPSRWGSHYLGLYFNDEPAGHMLDSKFILLNDNNTSVTVTKGADKTVTFGKQFGSGLNSTSSKYDFDISSGMITITSTPSFLSAWGTTANQNSQITNVTSEVPISRQTQTIYYPNGTISYTTEITLTYEPNGTVFNEDGQIVTDKGNISQFEPYQQVWDLNPLLNYTDAKNFFVSNLQTTLYSVGNQSYVKLYTSDYGLYWFDYAGGYDTVFAQFGWNNSRSMDIALCRGASTVQNKDWGVMVTWTYDQPPYLENASQLYSDMTLAYDNGAKYIVVFNSDGKSSGILDNDQFNAIQAFWQYAQSNPKTSVGSRDRVAYVLPDGYGYGFRGMNDSVWGLWQGDSFSNQQLTNINNAFEQYGSKLDVVFDDSSFSNHPNPYSRTIYWHGTITS